MALLGRWGLVLPSEIQWEFACKAGTETLWFTGNVPSSLGEYANTNGSGDGFAGLAPVFTKRLKANPFGLHQILGNVMEWCRDAEGKSTLWRGLRGGSWIRGLVECCSTWHNHAVAEDNAREVGLRPARLIH